MSPPSAQSTPVISATDLVLERGGRRILDGLSMSVPPESSLLVRGPSGAGKTSLFEVLGLLAPPDTGTLQVTGTDVTALGERERARLRRETLGFVFQDFQLIPDRTVRENVTLPREHAGEADSDWIDSLLDSLGIAALGDRYPHALSGGEKQRVAIARALANRPAIVLADEPTGQLDPAATDRVVELLFDLQARFDVALVVVSHDRQVGEGFDSIRRLVDGRLADGAIEG